MRILRWSRRDAGYFALIGLAELLIFFNNPRHFFMGDTLYWMGNRYRSVTEFLVGFVQVDPTLWYRPLAQRTVESLLYPFAGLNPIPYRVVMFLLFFACTIAVFVVTEQITESRRAAWIATLFFAPQVTHTFTTYDTAFVPEMVFTLFFAGSVVAYVRYLRTQSRRSLVVSAALFAGSLMSKETAVGLPLLLFVIWLFLPQKSRARFRSLTPHILILAFYLVFAIGYLHIRGVDIRQLFEKPGTAGEPGYQLVLGKNVLESLKLAFSWAFGIRRGTGGQWPPPGPVLISSLMIDALRVVRALVCVSGLLVLFTPKRWFLLIGVAWFLIAAAPTLPLLDHFLPYYLFAPLVGFSLAIGAVLDWAYERCASFSPRLAFALCALLIFVYAGVNAAESRVAAHHFLIGGSAELALNGMNDVRALHPVLSKGTTIAFFDEEHSSTSWSHARGMLFQMAYGDDSIKAEYLNDEYPFSITTEQINQGKALVFKGVGTHFEEITSFVKQRPELLLPLVPVKHYHLELSKSEVRVGGAYLMRVQELKDATVNILRAHNGILEDPFAVKLDNHGEIEIKVDNDTKLGTYTFVALQRAGEPNWVTVSGTIRVN